MEQDFISLKQEWKVELEDENLNLIRKWRFPLKLAEGRGPLEGTWVVLNYKRIIVYKMISDVIENHFNKESVIESVVSFYLRNLGFILLVNLPVILFYFFLFCMGACLIIKLDQYITSLPSYKELGRSS